MGFGKEMITGGGLVVGLRSRFSERLVRLPSTAFFLPLAAGVPARPIQFLMRPLAIGCVAGVLVQDMQRGWGRRSSTVKLGA